MPVLLHGVSQCLPPCGRAGEDLQFAAVVIVEPTRRANGRVLRDLQKPWLTLTCGNPPNGTNAAAGRPSASNIRRIGSALSRSAGYRIAAANSRSGADRCLTTRRRAPPIAPPLGPRPLRHAAPRAAVDADGAREGARHQPTNGNARPARGSARRLRVARGPPQPCAEAA